MGRCRRTCMQCGAAFRSDGASAVHCSPRCYVLGKSEWNSQGCRLWKGKPGIHGYGVAKIHGERYSAHRLSYSTFIGSIPGGMDVLHHCDVRTCVNPDHLFLGTALTNMRDCIQKGRNWRKLTDDDVRQIRSIVGISQRAIAHHYDVCDRVILKIRNGRSWKHLIDAENPS